MKQVDSAGTRLAASLGNSAIGTNTAAYAMAKRFGIGDKLPILIAEDGVTLRWGIPTTGCGGFSNSLTIPTAGGDPWDNEGLSSQKDGYGQGVLQLPHGHCDSLLGAGDITAVKGDRSRIGIIRDGRFALDGTEALNEALGNGSVGWAELAVEMRGI